MDLLATNNTKNLQIKNNTKENNIEIMNTIIENTLPNTNIVTLNDLIYALHQVFESNSVNIDYVSYLMKSYKSNPTDWKKFAKFDRYRYTRNLVDEGNGKFNLMLLCWGEGHGSAIHDHSNAHCFMKLLQGELEEVRFSWPEKVLGTDDTDTVDESSALQEISRSRLHLNNVCYINDTMGLHRVENPSHTNVAVSLHLYCPPFNSCHIFNQQTGKKTVSQVTFWSKFGSKRNRDVQANREPEDN